MEILDKKQFISAVVKTKKFKKKIAITIEEHIDKFTENYCNDQGIPFMKDDVYKEKANDIFNQIKKLENKDIIDLITKNPSKIIELKPNELIPEQFEKILKKKEVENSANNNQATTDIYMCNKCKTRRCQVYEKQTRCADEPATIFVNCLECGHSWALS